MSIQQSKSGKKIKLGRGFKFERFGKLKIGQSFYLKNGEAQNWTQNQGTHCVKTHLTKYRFANEMAAKRGLWFNRAESVIIKEK